MSQKQQRDCATASRRVYIATIRHDYATPKPMSEDTKSSEKPSNIHFHRDEHGALVKCYHRSRSVLLSVEFWLGATLSFPLEHFIWEKVWPFTIITKLLGL